MARFIHYLNGTFEPMHEIWSFFSPKTFFWSIMKMGIRKNFHSLSQGPPNPGFIQEKVQKGDFLKKDSRELKFFSCFRFLWISRRPGTLNWERVVFLPSKNLYRKCGRYNFDVRSENGSLHSTHNWGKQCKKIMKICPRVKNFWKFAHVTYGWFPRLHRWECNFY